MKDYLTVLVIDDNNSLSVFTDLIKNTGHRMVIANQSDVNLELVEEKQPDLVIADIDQFKENTPPFFSEIKSRLKFKHIRVALFTTSQEPLTKQGTISYADEFILKSFSEHYTQKRLHSIFETILAEKALKREERRKFHLKALLNTSRKINHLISQAFEPKILAQQICDLLSDNKGYNHAWIALFNEQAEIEHLAHSVDFYQDCSAIQDAFESNNPVHCIQKVQRARKTCVIHNPFRECEDCSLSKKFRNQSAYCAHLTYNDQKFGYITVLVPKEMAYDKAEQKFFSELASEISSALYQYNLIHQSKQVEQQNDLYAHIVKNSQHVMAVVDRSYKYVLVNNGYKQHFGWKAKDLLNKSLQEIWGEYFTNTLKPQLDKAFAGESVHFTSEILNKNSEYASYDIKIYPHKKHSGEVQEVICNAIDLTDLIISKEKLKETERRHLTLLSNLPGMSYRCKNEPGWEMEFVSQGVKTVTGYDPNDFISDQKIKYASLIHPLDQKYVWDTIQDALKNHTSFEIEYRIITKDQHIKWVWERGKLVPPENDDIEILEGVIIDITESKTAALEREISQKRFKRLFENTPDLAIQGYTPDGTIIYWNKAAEKIYGYKPEEALGKNLLDLIIPKKIQPLVREAISQGAKTGVMPQTEEIELQRKDGKPVTVLSSHVVIDIEGKQPELFCLDIDLTERKKIELELQQTKERYKWLFDSSPVALWEEDFTEVIAFVKEQVPSLDPVKVDEFFNKHPEKIFKTLEKLRVLDANKAAISLHDAESKDDLIKNLYKIFIPKSQAFLKSGLIAMISGEKEILSEVEVHTLTGKPIYTLVKLQFEEGTPDSYKAVISVVNITEIKRTENILKQSEEKFRTLFNLSPDAMFIQNFDQEIIEVNKTASDLFGYSDDDWFKHTVAEFQNDKNQKELEAITQELFIKGQLVFKTHIKTKKGDLIPVEVSAKIIKYLGENVVLTLVRDISDRKEAEAELKASEERYKNLFENNASVMLMIDPKDGKIFDANKQAVSYYGYDKATLLSMNINQINTLSDEFDEYEMWHSKEEPRTQFFFKHKLANGEIRDVEVFSGRVELNGNEFLYSIIHDIADRIKAEKAIKKRLHYEKLISDISKQALTLSDLDEFQNNCLKLLGESFDASRAYIFEYSQATNTYSNTHEWVAQGISAHKIELQNVSASTTTWWHEKMLNGNVINISNVDEIPSEHHKQLLKNQGIKSLLAVPTFSHNNYVGFIGLDECLTQKFWPKEDVEILQSVARLISVSIQRKKTENELLLSESRYKTLFELPQDFVFLHELDVENSAGYVVEVNRWACERLGYSRKDMLQRHLTYFFIDEDRTNVHQEISSLITKQELKIIKNLKSKSGEILPVEFNARLFKQNDKTYVISIGRDISERLNWEKEILENKERFEGIFNNMANGVLIYQAIEQANDFEVKNVNPAGAKIYPAFSHDIIGMRLSDLKSNAIHVELMEEAIKKVYTTGLPMRLSTHKQREHERDVWLEKYIFKLSSGEVIVVFEDVSERNYATEALRHSAEKYRLLAENVADIVWQMDLQMRFIYVSPSVYNITGFTVSEWLNMSVTDRSALKNQILMGRKIVSALKGKKHIDVITFETDLVRKDEAIIDVEISAKLIYSEKGKLIGVQGSTRDITLRKKAELQLRQSEEQLKSIFKASPIGIGLVENRKFERVNDTFCKMLGYSHQEFLLNDTRMIYDSEEEYLRIGKDHYDQINARGEAFSITKFRKKNGDLIDVQLRSNRIDLLTGEKKIIFTATDVTELTKADRALKESENKFRMVINAIKDVFWIKTFDCKEMVFCSPSYERVYSQSLSKLIQNPHMWDEIISENDRKNYKETVAQKLKQKLNYSIEYKIVLHNGIEKWILEKGFPIFDDEGEIEFIAGSSSDITKTKQLEREQANLQDQLRQSQKMEAVGQLAGGVAHDFNNILQATLGYSQMLKDMLKEDSIEYEFANEIYQGSDRAAGLTRQLLAFSRRQVIELVQVDLNKLIENLTKMLKRLIGVNVELILKLSPELSAVTGDVGQIEQILINLCLNARDAMPSGGVLKIKTYETRFDENFKKENTWAKHSDYIALEVSDTGCGMKQEIIDKVFDPFFTTKPLGKGTGLGLSTVYGIVKQHKGYIWIESEYEQGSTFKIYFPRNVDAQTPIDSEKDADPNPQRGSETILLAEDDFSLRRLVKKILSDYGYNVIEAKDGAEAIKKSAVNINKLDLALLDVMMPKKTGKAVCEELLKLRPELPVIFISGYTSGGADLEYVLKHGLAYIQKPFNLNKLLTIIREKLDETNLNSTNNEDYA